jgi:hypothetical protein
LIARGFLVLMSLVFLSRHSVAVAFGTLSDSPAAGVSQTVRSAQVLALGDSGQDGNVLIEHEQHGADGWPTRNAPAAAQLITWISSTVVGGGRAVRAGPEAQPARLPGQS